MMGEMDAITNPATPEGALAQLRYELDQGRRGVVLVTVDHGGRYRVSVCGDVSAPEVALIGALVTRHAVRLCTED